MLALILEEMELKDKALEVMIYLRDLAEETNNNGESILIYQKLGKMYQEKKDYNVAIIAFKRMLQISWIESDTHHETKAYE